MTIEKSCGAVVFTRVNGEVHYVLEQQLEGFFGLPKGHVEEDEDERTTALREIYEEVGLKPALLDGFRVTDEYPLPNRPDTRKQVVYFLGEYENQEIVIQQEELLCAKLLPYNQALDALTYESVKRVLRQAHDYLAGKETPHEL